MDQMMIIERIGTIRSPYRTQADAPRQGRLRGDEAFIEIEEKYSAGLKCLEEYSHIFVLYWLDRAERGALSATPPGSGRERGVFATRSPHRPNPVGLGIVDLCEIKGNTLRVKGLDALDGTAVIDIKPYTSLDAIPEIDDQWNRENH